MRNVSAAIRGTAYSRSKICLYAELVKIRVLQVLVPFLFQFSRIFNAPNENHIYLYIYTKKLHKVQKSHKKIHQIHRTDWLLELNDHHAISLLVA